MIKLISKIMSAANRWADKRVDNVMGVKPIAVDVLRMGKSNGSTDYFVRIICGDKNATPHVFDERWKAEYEVAHYQWVFGLRSEEPFVLDYSAETHPND